MSAIFIPCLRVMIRFNARNAKWGMVRRKETSNETLSMVERFLMSGIFFVNRCMAFLAVPLLIATGCVAAGDDAGGPNRKAGDIRVGGPCSYKSYDGKARITRIVKTEDSRRQAALMGGPGYEGYGIWFRFVPKAKLDVDGWPADALDREQALTLQNGWRPGPRFLMKYHLAAGNEYPCSLKIIETGTCTPIVFNFETIDTDDYFESRR